MMAKHLPPAHWQGRTDIEDAPYTERWHNRITPDEENTAATDFGLLGFACEVGVLRNKGRGGAAEGPAALRKQLSNLAWHGNKQTATDFGTVEVNDDDLEAGQQLLASHVDKALSKVQRLLVIGGGHETAWGSFNGLSQHLGPQARIGIINLDAHFDLRSPGVNGPSSGTPFYQIKQLAGDNFHYCCLGVARAANTKALFDRASQWNVSYREDHQMEADQIDDILTQVQDFCAGKDALYLTIDLDVLPHYQAPGVSAPAALGVPLSVIARVIAEVQRCAGNCRFGLPLVEITELSPANDNQGTTARTAAVLADRLLCP